MNRDTQDDTPVELAQLEQRFEPAGNDPIDTALQFGVASDLEQVLDAWRLVYTTYRRIGLIDPNPYRIHTNIQAPQPNSVVITGRSGDVTASTLTCIHDNNAGLPLDQEYRHELDALRQQGRRLTEIGLLADRRRHLARAADSLFMLMHYSLDYAFRNGADAVIGVHPRHARFYRRAFGFVPCGPQRTYAVVKNRPVILLKLEYDAPEQLSPLPRGLRYLMDHPVPENMYAKRYGFPEDQVADSPIGQYLRRLTK